MGAVKVALIILVGIPAYAGFDVNNPTTVGLLTVENIGDGTVSEVKLSFDPATQAELDEKAGEIEVSTATLRTDVDAKVADSAALQSGFKFHVTSGTLASDLYSNGDLVVRDSGDGLMLFNGSCRKFSQNAEGLLESSPATCK